MRFSDDRKVTFEEITAATSNELYYKEIPYTSGIVNQRLIITFSPKYATYQQTIRETQVDKAKGMIKNGVFKKNFKNPNNPARFVGKDAATKEGEAADIFYYLDEKRIMKTDFAARPVFVQREDRIKAHFLICFLALLNYRLLERQLGNKYTCTQLRKTRKEINFVDVEGQGFMPTYAWKKIIDELHDK